MRLRALALTAVLFPTAWSAFGQATVVSPQSCVWRAGDNPAWAALALDESSWQPYPNWTLNSSQPRIWIRCHLDAAALQKLERPAVQIRMFAAYEAFLNGIAFARNGNLDNGEFGMNLIQVFPLSRPLPGHDQGPHPDVLALRIVQRYASLGTAREIRLGEDQILRNDRAGYLVGQLPFSLLTNAPFIVIGIIGVVLLGFSLYDRTRIEPIVLAVSCVAVGLVFLERSCATLMVNEPVGLGLGLTTIASTVSVTTQYWFPFALARRRVPAIFWLPMGAWILSTVWQLFAFLLPLQVALRLDGVHASVLAPVTFAASALLGTAPLVAFWPWNRIPPRVRAIAGFSLAWGMSQSFFFTALSTAFSILPGIPNVFKNWMFPASTLAQFCVIAAIIALILRDQRQVALQRASLAGELRAAQEIQRALVPASIDTLPGLKIGIAFLPVREVGGDFYSCRILPGNRQRILLGDVSGKGAAAAMTAAVLLGAAQRRESDSPVEILRHLNLVMTDMRLGGFATCLCAELSAALTLTLANAGHLAPYRNGEEVKLDSGLPLGVAPDPGCSETTFQLAPGDKLTLLSDGIVEAQSATGELFGFDRTREISGQSAQEIATAAQRFGQQDDITVLTLSLAPAGP